MPIYKSSPASPRDGFGEKKYVTVRKITILNNKVVEVMEQTEEERSTDVSMAKNLIEII